MKKFLKRLCSVWLTVIMTASLFPNEISFPVQACGTLTEEQHAALIDTTDYIDFSPYVSKSHPRLYLSSFDGLKENYLSNSVTKAWYEALIKEAVAISDGSVMKYDIETLSSGGKAGRLIDSQTVLDRFYCLAFAAACEQNENLAQRLWLEIKTAIELPNWNPRHWLETAEMMHSVAVSYDWCYNFWTSEQKQLMKDAIIRFGLSQATREYAGHYRWFKWFKGMDGTKMGTNWTIVCNAGVLIASLAIFEEAPERCSFMINNAVRSMRAGLNAFSENGAYRESMAYWNYATKNLFMATDAFETAIGGSFSVLPEIEEPILYDFSKAPGISVTPDFPIYANGPAGTFSYGDASGGSKSSNPAFLWIGNRFGTPHYIEYHISNLEKKGMGGENIPLDLLWYEGRGSEKKLPDDRLFEDDFASLRSSWDDNDAIFVTLKGGVNGRGHQHYDLGTFVLDAFTTRFARTNGGDYGSSARWKIYKGRTEGQNTFVINPDETAGQAMDGVSEFESFYTDNTSSYAILNMTDAYARKTVVTYDEKNDEVHTSADTAVTSARRGMKMHSDKSRITVQDEVTMNRKSDYYWFMHTSAEITLYNNNKSARLNLNGKYLYANVLSDNEDACFEIMDAEPLPSTPIPEKQDLPPDSVSKLTIHLKDITKATVAVEFVPSEKSQPFFSDYIIPLDDWHPENDVTRFGRELTIYGDDRPGRVATMLVKSPLGNIYGIDQDRADSKGEYAFNCTLPENYENGVYSVYLNGNLYKTFNVTDGTDADVPPASYTIKYDLPDGVNSSVLVAAEYNNECMVQYTNAAYDKTTSTASVSFDFNPSKGSILKFFYLSDLDSLTPLYPALEMTVD